MARSTNNFYSSSASGGREIDMRTEFVNTMYGSGQEISKRQKGLQRIIRLDNDGLEIPCPCVDSVTKEPDRDVRCPVCLGDGVLWDESALDFYHIRIGLTSGNALQDRGSRAGIINTEIETFYIPFQFNLTKGDKLVTLLLDKEGNLVIPLTRTQIFRISEVRPTRLDNGRLEFWKAFCYEDNAKFL